THANSIKIGPERDSHGEPPSFATLNQTLADSEIPSPSRALRALVLRSLKRKRFFSRLFPGVERRPKTGACSLGTQKRRNIHEASLSGF
ncbi:MAG TPA: hypothetical protein VFE60_02835, partial [Roseiarcus sp.]|nr:hypothetical protein [Roseiarcus sp.]